MWCLAAIRVRRVAVPFAVSVVIPNVLYPFATHVAKKLQANLHNRTFDRDERHFKSKTVTDLRSPRLLRQSSPS
jgi:hypothetical protein